MRIHLTIETIANGFLVSADRGEYDCAVLGSDNGATFFASEPEVYEALPNIYAKALIEAEKRAQALSEEQRVWARAKDAAFKEKLDGAWREGVDRAAFDPRTGAFTIGADQPADQEAQQQGGWEPGFRPD